jgi:hypothetical protein
MTEALKHELQKEYTPHIEHQLFTQTEGFIWEDFRLSAFRLNELGVPPCRIIAVLEDMVVQGDLRSCQQCGESQPTLPAAPLT